ncbi:MAG: hypothetical protein AB7H88_11515 [Vicinamibacterales bacterium]
MDLTLRRAAGCWLLAAGLAAGLATPAHAQAPAPADEGYALGQGLALGDSGVRLGGYANLDWENATDEIATLAFDDLSLFVFGDLGARVRFFVEVEDAHFWQVDSRGDAVLRHNGDLERLYVDYLWRDGLKLRAGKFLTPVGTWNEIHADPLTWTVSRPVASYATFPAFTTGVEAFGTWSSDARDVEYNVFVQGNEALDNSTGDRRTERMVGGRVRVRQGAVEIGAPLVHYVERDTGDRVTFSGLDLVARTGPVEIRAEATAGRVTARAGGAGRAEYAGYLQAVWAVGSRWYLVARQEAGRSREDLRLTATSAGVLFRPVPAIALKLEIQGRSGRFLPTETATGGRVFAGFGILF